MANRHMISLQIAQKGNGVHSPPSWALGRLFCRLAPLGWCHMTQTYAGVINKNMFSGPDFARESEYGLRIAIASMVQKIFEKH